MCSRSPLNVVHAGLDLLLAEVRSEDPTSPHVPIQRSTADFIVHMFTSSESAINILNDLLQYEHMEAGMEISRDPTILESLNSMYGCVE